MSGAFLKDSELKTGLYFTNAQSWRSTLEETPVDEAAFLRAVPAARN